MCRTRGHAPGTRWIRVRYATWRIVDHIVGQRLRIQLVHGSDTACTRFKHGLTRLGPVFSLGLKNPTFALLPQRHNFFSQKHKNHTQRNWISRLRSESESRHQISTRRTTREKVCFSSFFFFCLRQGSINESISRVFFFHQQKIAFFS